MGRKATNTDIQIQNLKDRGMILDYKDSKVKEFLLDIGYYRLGFYWNPFEIGKEHIFAEGTLFSDVIKLYYLDVDLRNILAKYINRIEINFRTKLVYYVSNKYKESPTWFNNPTIINSNFVNNLNKFYSPKFIRDNKAIKKHHDKYTNDKYAPAWKTLEFFTFGTILNIYRNVKDEAIKTRISNEFGVRNHKKFVSLLEATVLVRNICAHGDVLFDLRKATGISVIPDINFNESDRSSLDACIKVILYFLGKVSENRRNELEEKITELFEEASKNKALKKIITESINYKP